MSSADGTPRRLWPEEKDLVAILAPARERLERDPAARCRSRPPRLTAADFTPERMLRAAGRPPDGGWRRALYELSGGRVVVPPSTASLRLRELTAQTQAPIVGCRTIAFVSRKGGVGKTTTCLIVGHTFASQRSDRVIAVDANPDGGTLGHRLRRETSETLHQLLQDAQTVRRYADLRAYVSQASTRLDVVAGDERDEVGNAVSRTDIRRAVATLERHFNLLCLDTAAGVLGSANQGVLAAADQIVVVANASLDSARAASSTLDWLEDHGYEHLARSAVAVVNRIRNEPSAVDLDRITGHFAARCRACIRVPWDPHLESGAEISIERLRFETRQAYMELAAAIARGFTEPAARRS